MEIITLFIVAIVLWTTFTFLLKIFNSPKSIEDDRPFPPGSSGLALVWDSLQLLLSMWKGNSHKFIQDRITKFQSSTFKTSFFFDPTTIMHGADGNKFLFKNEGKLVRTWFPNNIQSLFPRSFYSKARFVDLPTSILLKPERLQMYVGIMDSMAMTHLEAKWHTQKQIKVYPMVKDFSSSLACRLFLSTEDANLIAELNVLVDELVGGFAALPINLPWTRFGRAIRASKAINTLLVAVIKRKRQELSNLGVDQKDLKLNQDAFSCLLLNGDESGMSVTDGDVAEWIIGILLAGRDSSSVTISIMLKHIAQDPEIYHKVFQEHMEIAKSKSEGEVLNWNDIQKMKYSWCVAQETMRICPPGQAVFREAISDFEYDGYKVHKGWKLVLSIQAMHRDPKYFSEPERFDPSRFENDGPLPYTFVAFGGGPNICPGRNFAKIQILVFLHNVVKSFKWEIIQPNEGIVVEAFARPANGLPVRLHPH